MSATVTIFSEYLISFPSNTGPGIDKMRERASAARRHLLNFCRHILKYWHFNNI